MKVSDLVHRRQAEGFSAVYLHAKFPEHMREADDLEGLLHNETQLRHAEETVEALKHLEQSGCNSLAEGNAEHYSFIHRHYFLRGVLAGLREIGAATPKRRSTSTLAIYNQASHLETSNELDEARRLFNLVLNLPDEEYWSGAEYHLGCIEFQLGNASHAHKHFIECLRLNPSHEKAQLALNNPAFHEQA
jgi:TolA-binding protein